MRASSFKRIVPNNNPNLNFIKEKHNEEEKEKVKSLTWLDKVTEEAMDNQKREEGLC